MNLYSLIAVAIFVTPFCLGILAFLIVHSRKLSLKALETKVSELDQALGVKAMRMGALERDVANLMKIVTTVAPKKVSF